MNIRFPKIFLPGALAVGMVLVGGCKTVCRSNLKQGYATIYCQPEDVTVHDSAEPLTFKVGACGRGLTYRWYRNDQPVSDNEKLAHGADTQELTIRGPWLTTNAEYSCAISSKNCQGEDVYTESRVAYYTYNPPTSKLIMSDQYLRGNLPKPAGPQNMGDFQYCSVSPALVFNLPPGSTLPRTCSVSLQMVEPPNTGPTNPVPPGNYYLKIIDANNNPVSVEPTKSFTWKSANGAVGVLRAYCNCGFPSDKPNLIFKLTWQ